MRLSPPQERYRGRVSSPVPRSTQDGIWPPQYLHRESRCNVGNAIASSFSSHLPSCHSYSFVRSFACSSEACLYIFECTCYCGIRHTVVQVASYSSLVVVNNKIRTSLSYCKIIMPSKLFLIFSTTPPLTLISPVGISSTSSCSRLRLPRRQTRPRNRLPPHRRALQMQHPWNPSREERSSQSLLSA